MEDSLTSLIITAFFILLKFVLTLAYSSLVNASKANLRERVDGGDKSAKKTLRLAEDAKSLLALHQYLSILLTVIIATLVILTFMPIDQQEWSDNLATYLISFIVLMPILSALILVFTERVPIGVVMGRAEPIAIMVTGPMSTLLKIFAPFVFLNLEIGKKVAQMLGGAGVTHLVTEEEIKTLVDAGSEEGVIEDEAKEMIYSIIRFGDTVAREVMLPRIDIVALEIDSTMEDALAAIITKGHSRIPVYKDNIDNIEGVLYAKDLLEIWQAGTKPTSLSGLLRDPHFVPESKKASDLLIEMQNRKIHLVFVVDEYGGTAGLVTLEDLVEEIVGEIQDEYDYNEESLYQKVDDNTYIFSARIDLDNLNHLLDANIPTDETDTLGGFIFSTLERVPVPGDEFTSHDLLITVQSVTGRRIRKVKVEKIIQPEVEATPEKVEEKAEATPPPSTPTPPEATPDDETSSSTSSDSLPTASNKA